MRVSQVSVPPHRVVIRSLSGGQVTWALQAEEIASTEGQRQERT